MADFWHVQTIAATKFSGKFLRQFAKALHSNLRGRL
jgi:hypothetical protein